MRSCWQLSATWRPPGRGRLVPLSHTLSPHRAGREAPVVAGLILVSIAFFLKLSTFASKQIAFLSPTMAHHSCYFGLLYQSNELAILQRRGSTE